MLEPWKHVGNSVGPSCHTHPLESCQHTAYTKVQDGVAHEKGAGLPVCIPQNHICPALAHVRALPVQGSAATPVAVHRVTPGSQTPISKEQPALPLLRQDQRDYGNGSTLRLSTHRAGLGSVWNPGCPVKPSDKLQHAASNSWVSRLIKGWSQETEEVNSRNLIFQHLRDRTWGGGREVPPCFFKWLHFLSRTEQAVSTLSSLLALIHSSGSEEAVDTCVGRPASMRTGWTQSSLYPCPLLCWGPSTSLSETPVFAVSSHTHTPSAHRRQRTSRTRILEGKQVR